jgi:ABC-type nickel/cobalt efflux system permease component RcnA
LVEIAHNAPLGLALLGLLLGMRHATDPDHVIAVTTIVSRERRLLAASRVGMVWGLGHTLTVLTVGAMIIVFKIAIPARLGLAMEFGVAIVLMLLGIGGTARLLQRLRRGKERSVGGNSLTVHSDTHAHGMQPHWHPHVLDGSSAHMHDNEAHYLPSQEDPIASRPALRRPLWRAFAVGLVHGLAGSAAVALLVLSAIPQPLWATVYLVIVCAGTILGMALITTAIAAPIKVASGRLLWVHQSFVMGSGMLSFGFGLFLAYQLGVVDHLFGAAPLWTPH